MTLMLRVFVVLFGLLFIVVSSRDMVNRQMSENQGLFWIVSGAIMILFGLFPGLTFLLAGMFGVEYAPSMIFMVTLMILIVGLFYCFRKLSNLHRKVQELAIQVSLLNHENMLMRSKSGDLHDSSVPVAVSDAQEKHSGAAQAL